MTAKFGVRALIKKTNPPLTSFASPLDRGAAEKNPHS